MAWTWRYIGADGATPPDGDLPAEAFTSRGDAESWLGENWRALAEDGVGRVALMDGDREVYAMALATAE
ncbi:hypothetical protein BJF83_15795 [Nocardiopsis sp. CNR-923]|uniref:hypothetical protein n=1 Tax=Nocardiopsis sp. CNR-923 TaxID=1904965 RepID=UPI00095F38D9|nr:hypothetical protein [Nocardiopsis sp. CNR-923]OLT28255.1 hypothetical protein BJF83_15795 [Nocardiopsis sp. CNR-923]